jgi:hypothetical protein
MHLERIPVEESLRQKLNETQAAYRRAMDEYRRLMAISTDTSDLQNPALVDGNHAVRRAILIHQQARVKYEQALKAFNEFVIDGKLPPPHTDA